MIVSELLPCPVLQPYVRNYLLIHLEHLPEGLYKPYPARIEQALVFFARGHPTPFSLDWLANQANLSPRQFERKFSERMGIGPKLYSRISRFYQTFDYKEKHPQIDWLTVAVRFGYTDYDHLAKDFKQFTNVTPNIILREYAQRPEMIVNL